MNFVGIQLFFACRPFRCSRSRSFLLFEKIAICNVGAEQQEQDWRAIFRKEDKEQRCSVHVFDSVIGADIGFDHVDYSRCYDNQTHAEH